jgi:hypothetical protein
LFTARRPSGVRDRDGTAEQVDLEGFALAQVVAAVAHEVGLELDDASETPFAWALRAATACPSVRAVSPVEAQALGDHGGPERQHGRTVDLDDVGAVAHGRPLLHRSGRSLPSGPAFGASRAT